MGATLSVATRDQALAAENGYTWPAYTRCEDLASFRLAWCGSHFGWDLTPSRDGLFEGALFSRRYSDVHYSDIVFGAVGADRTPTT